MRRLAYLAMPLLLAGPANAQDGLDSIFRGIQELIHAHHHHEHEYYQGDQEYYQGPEPGPGPEAPPPQEILGPEMPRHIIAWLEKHGEHTPLIVGRRDQDCANAHAADFYGGWGVLLKHPAPAPGQFTAVSGVVCVDQHGPQLQTDK